MKILLVHNFYREPGGEDMVFRQEKQLLENAGHQVFTYERSNHELVQLSPAAMLGTMKRTVWASDSRREFLALLRREKPELVHVHNTFMMISPSIYSACREEGVPVVQTLHNYRLLCAAGSLFRDGNTCEECLDLGPWNGVRYGCYRGSRWATATVALMLSVHRAGHTWEESVDLYIALTEFARRKFIEGGLPAARIAVKSNFADPDPGQRTGHGDYALYVGRLSKEKGAPLLLDAWERLGNGVPLQIIGDGPLFAELQAGAIRRGLGAISFAGRLSHNETIEAIKRSRFLVVPSQCYENFPMAVVEAYACGVPVIASRLGAMEELIEEGRTGELFDPADPQDVADKVEWGWANPALMESFGREARLEYENKYTAASNYTTLLDLYERAMAAHTQLPYSQASQVSTVAAEIRK